MSPTTNLQEATRLGGGLLVLGTLTMMVGAAIPFLSPSLSQAPWTDDPQVAAAAIAGNPTAYAWANGMFMAAGLITALGLVPISLGFPGRARPWAMMGVLAFAIGATSSAINRTINIKIITWAAVQHIDPGGELAQMLIRFQSGLEQLTHLLAYLSIALFGVALIRRANPGWLGWLFFSAGLIGLIAWAVAAPIPAFIFFGTGALGVTSWIAGPGSEGSDPAARKFVPPEAIGAE